MQAIGRSYLRGILWRKCWGIGRVSEGKRVTVQRSPNDRESTVRNITQGRQRKTALVGKRSYSEEKKWETL